MQSESGSAGIVHRPRFSLITSVALSGSVYTGGQRWETFVEFFLFNFYKCDLLYIYVIKHFFEEMDIVLKVATSQTQKSSNNFKIFLQNLLDR